LEDNGAVVKQALDGDEAIQILRREKFDLVTLDLNMPGKDGASLEFIRKDEALAGTRVCIVTGRPELAPPDLRASGPGAGSYLDNTVDEATLLLNVRKILEVT